MIAIFLQDAIELPEKMIYSTLPRVVLKNLSRLAATELLMRTTLLICLCMLIGFSSCHKERNNQVRIAILTPLTHPSLEQCEKGFVQTLQQDPSKKYSFVTYNAQGNKTLMRSEIEEIIRKDYDMIYSIGTLSSQMITEVFTRKGITTPVIFTCVNDPVNFKIVNSEESSGNMVTGVKELLDFRQELTHLLHFKSDIKTLLLVYNPTEPGLEKDRKELSKLAQELEIDLLTVEVFQTNELISKVPPFVEKADAMILLKDNTVIAGLDSLVKMCDRYHVPLMASDLDSPDKGAAFGFGVHEIQFGIEAAKKALRILAGVRPTEIPVTPVSEFTLRVNYEAAKQQGVSDDLLCQLNQ